MTGDHSLAMGLLSDDKLQLYMVAFVVFVGALLFGKEALGTTELSGVTGAVLSSVPALNDDVIDLQELMVLANSTAEATQQTMQDFDTDGNGKLDRNELLKLLLSGRSGLNILSQILMALFAIFGMLVACTLRNDTRSPLRKYTLTTKLGEGTYGEVFKCHKKHDTSRNDYQACYAIKFLTVNNVPLANEALTEAVRLSRCHHKNLVGVHDEFFHNRWNELGIFSKLFLSPYQFCIVMDLCTGGSLANLIQEWIYPSPDECMTWVRPKPSVDSVIDIVQQVASGCAHLHSKNLIHLDLKHENVFVSPGVGGEGILCQVGDLGLAEETKKTAPSESKLRKTKTSTKQNTKQLIDPHSGLFSNATALSRPKGTIGYIAPELYLDFFENITCKCDAWSLGIMAVELSAAILGQWKDAFAIVTESCGDIVHSAGEDDWRDLAHFLAGCTHASENFHILAITNYFIENGLEIGPNTTLNEIITGTLAIEADTRLSCAKVSGLTLCECAVCISKQRSSSTAS